MKRKIIILIALTASIASGAQTYMTTMPTGNFTHASHTIDHNGALIIETENNYSIYNVNLVPTASIPKTLTISQEEFVDRSYYRYSTSPVAEWYVRSDHSTYNALYTQRFSDLSASVGTMQEYATQSLFNEDSLWEFLIAIAGDNDTIGGGGDQYMSVITKVSRIDIKNENGLTLTSIYPPTGSYFLKTEYIDVFKMGTSTYLSAALNNNQYAWYRINQLAINDLTIHDTLWLHDTLYIHDTIYISQEGIENIESFNAKIYQQNGKIVVEGADRNTVTLYDITGRMIGESRPILSRQDYSKAISIGHTFDVPTSGVYLIKIGNSPTKKFLVIR